MNIRKYCCFARRSFLTLKKPTFQSPKGLAFFFFLSFDDLKGQLNIEIDII